MCFYRKVEGELSVCLKTKTPSSIQKKKLKLKICVWTPMAWPRTVESTFPFKIPSCKSWEMTQLSKMICDDAFLTVQQFGNNIVLPRFPATFSFLKVLEVPSLFGEYLIFKTRAFDYFSQFKCCVKRASNFFIVLMVSPLANSRAWP